MPSWNRDSDRALDAELRAARPEPTPEVTHAIADWVRPRQTAGTHRFGRLHLALAGCLTALVLTPVVAMGFGGLGSLGKSTKAKSKQSASLVRKANKGRALGALTTNRARALSSLAHMRGTSSLAAMAPAGGNAALAAQDSPSAFFGNVFAPQNDLQATQDEYDQVCDLDALIQDNHATLTQGGNTATGGNATGTGGAGGNANTGNTQTSTGGTTGGGGISFGGDTTATSGNATGGAGGAGTATGGNAVAGNVASQTLINVVCVPTP